MATVHFAPALQSICPAPAVTVAGDTVAAALGAAFEIHGGLRSYVLDDQGSVRKHVAVFVNNEAISDRRCLTDPLAGDAEIYIMQALSGG